jgi:D-beta-D-heptose 7-phosphate kinase/D-beta-D-heptose 1-phosphate adenosyltransferase
MSDFNILLNKNNAKVLVIGDIMLDRYIFGECTRISPEAPVPVLEEKYQEMMLGGAGNVLLNFLSFGGDADLITITGDDKTGEEILHLLTQNGINNLEGIFIDNSRKSTLKQRFISSNQQLLRLDSETKIELSPLYQEKILKYFLEIVNNYKLVIISDYGKGLLSSYLCQSIINECNKLNIKVLVDPKSSSFEKYRSAYLIKPNLNEFKLMTKSNFNDNAFIGELASKVKAEFNIGQMVITLGSEGMFLSENFDQVIPAKLSEVYDVSGAGDTVLATLAIGIINEFSLFESCQLASIAAAEVIKKFGTGKTSIQEVLKNM